MATGTVKWFSDDKGFGFVTPDEPGKDLFVHHTDIDGEGFRSLAEGARVEYEAAAGRQGPEGHQRPHDLMASGGSRPRTCEAWLAPYKPRPRPGLPLGRRLGLARLALGVDPHHVPDQAQLL